MLADKLQLAGWMISRSGVSKIEGGLIYVPDFRLLYINPYALAELVGWGDREDLTG
jgi:hypothetical protein